MNVVSGGGLAGQRNTQIDGWRALAVLGVMWHHWAPKEWREVFPFEIGLFFFLTLTGFLISRILLNARESPGVRMPQYGGFLRRRIGRLALPCMVAMGFAWLCGADDIREHPWWYVFHLSNFHMALNEAWPSGTAPLWTLAIQIQFYFVWPLLILWTSQRVLPWLFALCMVLAPVSRWGFATFYPQVFHSEAIPLCALDYFGAGALLAWFLRENRADPHGRVLAIFSLPSVIAYVWIYTAREWGARPSWSGYCQQSFLALAMACLIGLTLHGFKGGLGRLLDHPIPQHIGKISYGLYLFHAIVPLALGYLMPFLWVDAGAYQSWLTVARLVVFALASWGTAWACWRWLEGGGK